VALEKKGNNTESMEKPPMQSCIEIAWIRKAGKLTYIDPTIAERVGYTADEVREMEEPISILIAPQHAQSLLGLLRGDGHCNGVVTQFLDKLNLRHRHGHEICCEATIICFYDDGKLAEAWGAVRCLPDQCQHNELTAWWKVVSEPARRTVCDTMGLYPVPA
jgi:hypothetical protein